MGYSPPCPYSTTSMIFSTSSYNRHTEEQMAQLAGWGFTHVLQAREGNGWEDEVELGHRYGLKMMTRWPNWSDLRCLGADMAFRNYEGATNVGHSLYSGPSVWNQESGFRAQEALPAIMAEGWDGVLVHILVGDRPMPTAWHLSGHRERKNHYWCFDEDAKEQYGILRRNKPMPTCPAELEDLEFYKWYQSGWLTRLRAFTATALEYTPNVWTWFIPLNFFDAETMADGTADSVPAMTEWQQSVRDSGGDPLIVVAHMFGMGNAWEKKARRTMQEQNRLGWRSIVGAECNPGVAAAHLCENGSQALRMGFTGLLCGDAALYQEADRVKPFRTWWEWTR
jgi:hypothetical protein